VTAGDNSDLTADGPDNKQARLRGTRRTRIAVVVFSFVLASVVAFLVQRLVPPPATDLVLVCSIWVAFYGCSPK